MVLICSIGVFVSGLALLFLTYPNGDNSGAIPDLKTIEPDSNEASPPVPVNENPHAFVIPSELTQQAEALSFFEDLRSLLLSLPREEATAWIEEYLNSGHNLSSPLAYQVGPMGRLNSYPSLRLFLLDFIVEIDPESAAQQSKLILNFSDNSDEWSLAFRNLAWTQPNSDMRTFLEGRFREMVNRKNWITNPSAGFLESFDLAVFLGKDRLAPELSNLLATQDNPAVAHAAFIALDRKVQADPTAMLNWLLQEKEALDTRLESRASLFSRADIRDPRQRALVETFILSPGRSDQELKKFAELFPNANFFVSNNLLTEVQTPTGGGIAARDAFTLQQLETWRNDPRFSVRIEYIETILLRLRTFSGYSNSDVDG